MKNIIAITSLLAAGTLCANAATTTPTEIDIGGNYYADAFEFTFEIPESFSITGDYDLLAAYYHTTTADGGFTGNVFELTANEGENAGYTLALSRVYSITLTNNALTSESTYSKTNANGNATTFNTSVFKKADSTAFAIVASGIYTVKYLGGANNSAAADLYFGDEKVASFTGGQHNMNGGGSSGTNPIYFIGNSSYNVSLIPEPSAFGLLAGLGALALAGTRRRRRK